MEGKHIITAIVILFLLFISIVVNRLSEEVIYIGEVSDIQTVHFREPGIFINSVTQFLFIPYENPSTSIFRNKEADRLIDYDDYVNICTWRNFQINSPEEVATKVNIYSTEFSVTADTNLTVRPISCSFQTMFLTDNYPNNPGRIFRRVEDGDIHETDRLIFDTDDNYSTSNLETTPPPSTIRREFQDIEGRGTVLVDHTDGVWFIYKTSLLQRGISSLLQLQILER